MYVKTPIKMMKNNGQKIKLEKIRYLAFKFRVKQEVIKNLYHEFDQLFILNDNFEPHFNMSFQNNSYILK